MAVRRPTKREKDLEAQIYQQRENIQAQQAIIQDLKHELVGAKEKKPEQVRNALSNLNSTVHIKKLTINQGGD